MPPRRPEDWWRDYTPSAPLPAEGGLASSRQRGPMAVTWWSRRFTGVLESYGLGGRMQRGRRYARTGQVLSLDVEPGVIGARVQGSRPQPYVVTVELAMPTARQWATVEAAMSAKVGFVAQLLAGELPSELEQVFSAAGVALFPPSWASLRAACSCPDWGNPCKHIAAVLYVFADQLDTDPWLLLMWRGRTREDILRRFRSVGRAPDREPEVAPWWPFPTGALPDAAAPGHGGAATPAAESPDAVFESMDVLEVTIGGAPMVDLLRPVYRAIVDGTGEETG